jgi:ribose 5-phosphate isomerase B
MQEAVMIYVAGDHHAEPTLARIRAFLSAAGHDFREFGFQGGKVPTAKLQDFIPQLARAVQSQGGATGILVCGTGAGVEIGANRFHGIRASLCSSPKHAEWARTYDDANVLCLASWALEEMQLEEILNCWFRTEYDGDEARRNMFRTFDSWAVSP